MASYGAGPVTIYTGTGYGPANSIAFDYVHFNTLTSSSLVPEGFQPAVPEPLNILGAITGLALFGTVSTALKRRKRATFNCIEQKTLSKHILEGLF